MMIMQVRKRMLLAVLTALVTSVLANDNTHVNNLSSKDVCGTTSYTDGDFGVGNSKFIKRKIPAHNSAVDTYSSSFKGANPKNSKFKVNVELWVLREGEDCDRSTATHGTISVSSDHSVTLKDGDDGGVDVFDAGTDNKLKDKSLTIFTGQGLCKAIGKAGSGQAGAYEAGKAIPLDVQSVSNNLPLSDFVQIVLGDGSSGKTIYRTKDDKNVHSGIGTPNTLDAGLDQPILWWADFEAGGTKFESCKLSYKDQIEVKGVVTDGPGANIPFLVNYKESVCTVEFKC